jgi:hypothetical protein
MKKTNVDRMELAKVVTYFASLNLAQTALYFASHIHDSVTVDGWIEEDFVRRHIGDDLMQKLKCEVLTWVA